MTQETLISIDQLSTEYLLAKKLFGADLYLKAVDNVSLDIPRGSFFGLVGESGCGKTTLGMATLKASPISKGSISFNGSDGANFDIGEMNSNREIEFRRYAQLIFQDPYAALSPRMTVRDIIAEPLEVMKLTRSRQETDERVREMAAKCRLNVEHLRRFPHAFSGGQRQRISIARALITKPLYVVADESVAALDVSIQADILNLLKDLQSELGLTILFISHDLSVVAHICDQVAVMYLGGMVEITTPQQLFTNPAHPYSSALISAIPSADPRNRSRAIKLEGEVPSPADPPSGCRFHTRCPFARDRCKTEAPELRTVRNGQRAACHFSEDLADKLVVASQK